MEESRLADWENGQWSPIVVAERIDRDKKLIEEEGKRTSVSKGRDAAAMQAEEQPEGGEAKGVRVNSVTWKG